MAPHLLHGRNKREGMRRKDGSEPLGYWGTSFAAPAAAVQFMQHGLSDPSQYVPCEGAE